MTIDHIYLSPHLDDAVFSCGGLIRQQRARGERVLVVTVFTESPPPDSLSTFARTMQRVWTDQLDPLAVRRAEDEAAMRALGAEFIHLSHYSAMYRTDADGRHLYQGVSMFGKVNPDESDLAQTLAAQFARLRLDHPTATIYIPLTVGNHVDHQQVNLAARNLPGPLRYYEDFPYVVFGVLAPLVFRLMGFLGRLGVRPMDNPDMKAHPLTWPALLKAFHTAPPLVSGPKRAQRQVGRHIWEAQLYPIDLVAKLQDTLHYPSQVRMVFGNEYNLQRALEAYALSLGQTLGLNIPHERLWTALAPVPVPAQPPLTTKNPR